MDRSPLFESQARHSDGMVALVIAPAQPCRHGEHSDPNAQPPSCPEARKTKQMTIEHQLARTIREIVRDEIRRHAVLPPPGEEWTPFKRAVYDAVFMIPYGKVASFSRCGPQVRASGIGTGGWQCARGTRIPLSIHPLVARRALHPRAT